MNTFRFLLFTALAACASTTSPDLVAEPPPPPPPVSGTVLSLSQAHASIPEDQVEVRLSNRSWQPITVDSYAVVWAGGRKVVTNAHIHLDSGESAQRTVRTGTVGFLGFEVHGPGDLGVDILATTPALDSVSPH